MNKSHLAIGVLVTAALVTGVVLTRPAEFASNNSNLASPVGATEDSSNKTVVVNYTDTGFTPVVTSINRGDSIIFVNASASGRALRIAPVSDPKDATSAYLGFESAKSIKKGETYGVSITLPGIWAYKDLNSPKTVGIVIVE